MKKLILVVVAILSIIMTGLFSAKVPIAAANSDNLTPDEQTYFWEQSLLLINPHALDFLKGCGTGMQQPLPTWMGLDGFTVAINKSYITVPWEGDCRSHTMSQDISLCADDVTVFIAANTTINKGGCLEDSLQLTTYGNPDMALQFQPGFMTFSQLVTVVYAKQSFYLGEQPQTQVMYFTEIKDGCPVLIDSK